MPETFFEVFPLTQVIVAFGLGVEDDNREEVADSDGLGEGEYKAVAYGVGVGTAFAIG